jgi:hypothetical protein
MNLFNPFTTFRFLYQADDKAGGDSSNTDDSAGGEEADKAGKQKESKPNLTAEQQKYVDELIGNARTKEREKAKAEAEAKAKADKEAADKEALKEQGKFKELAEKAEQKAAKEKERADAAEQELKNMRTRRAFELKVTELGLAFVDPKASEDAFTHLDLERVGEDLKGMEAAVKALAEDRQYLFEEVSGETKNIDATERGKQKPNVRADEIVKRKRSSGQYSGI